MRKVFILLVLQKVKPRLKKRPSGFLGEIKETIDAGEPKKEGNVSMTNIQNLDVVKKGKDLIHEGKDFRTAYDFFLKSVIGKIYR